MDEVPDETAAALGRALPMLARAIVKTTGCKDYNILQNNGASAHQAVPHVHFHIIPKPSEELGLGVGWPAGQIDDGAAMAEKISSNL